MATIEPAVFTKVDYQIEEINRVVEKAVRNVDGAPSADDIRIVIEEDLSTTRSRVASLDPLVFEMDSGALEEVRDPRSFGPRQTEAALTRLLLEVGDRTDAAFGAPDVGAPTDLGLRIAWDVTLYGRVSRLGVKVHQPKYRYDFRNRVGFSDAADALFDQLWAARPATWSDVVDQVETARSR